MLVSPGTTEAKTSSENTAKSAVHVANISDRCRSIMNDKNALCVDKQPDGKYYVTHFQSGKAVKKFLASPGMIHKDGGTYTPE